MAKIHILDEHIANQIAAGEVVERPASVVKELVENAIDAGSTRIEVSVEEGACRASALKIMAPGLILKIARPPFTLHATSKILNGRDLFQITSLGFRGEALPSIAAVSKVSLLTATADDGKGRLVDIEGGNLIRNEDAPSGRGSDLAVRELFFNTLTRLKYMKSIQTELGHISDAMYRMALAHPGISFTLHHNGNQLLHTLGNGDLLQVIAAVYGTNAAKAMLPITAEDLDYRISGYISRPEWTRSNRNAITTIVGGRYIRSNGLNAAIMRAYHTLLPINRYPLLVLELDMHPSLVDVNVHPAKLEVRFSKENELYTFVEQEIRKILLGQSLIPRPSKETIGPKGSSSFIQEQFAFSKGAVPPSSSNGDEKDTAPKGSASFLSGLQSSNLDRNSRDFSKDGQADHQVAREVAPAYGSGYPSSSSQGRQTNANTSYSNSYRPQETSMAQKQLPSVEKLWAPPQQEEPGLPAFPELNYIGQHHGTYIIAQNDGGLYLIDQHAAHERINYEYFYEKFGRPEDASQELLLPITLEFTPSESRQLSERLHWFQQAGVYLEHFGGQTFLVRSLPYWFPEGDEKAVVEEMAEWVLSERMIDLAKLREKSSILCSCKASIKANHKLTEQEVEALLSRLAECKQPYTCPHGRPIVISFSSYDLEKLFKRVM